MPIALTKLPPPATAEFEKLLNDIHHTHVLWQQYSILFARDSARVAVLNKVAPGFFALVQGVLIDNVIVRICLLLDPAKQRGTNPKTNLVLESLVERVESTKDKAVAKLLRSRLAKLHQNASALRSRRNKRLAHRDYADAMGATRLAPVTKAKIDDLLNGLYEFMSEISVRYSDLETNVGPGVLGGDASNLITDLEALVYAESLDPLWVPRTRHEMMLARQSRLSETG